MCVLATTYLINKMPMKRLRWKSPFELLFKRPPLYDTLWVVGCLCFATNTSPSCDKFESKGSKCVFLGYEHSQKGYKLYNFDTKKILISRDVVFFEHLFPYHDAHLHSSLVPSSLFLPMIQLEIILIFFFFACYFKSSYYIPYFCLFY